MVTSTAGALAGGVFAGRIAYRLTGPGPAWARFAAAGFAAVGVLGISGYAELVLFADSDPLVAALCLAAIDLHLSGRRRSAFVMVLLASLGRPEVWLFAGLYALWLWRAVASLRVVALAGVLLIPAAWFVVPALTSRSWFTAGDLALNSPCVIHGSKIVGVFERFRGLYAVPMQLAWLFAVALAVARRDRVWLTLVGAAVLWVAVEIGFAYHGWPALPRYVIEPAAVMVALAGAAVGRVLGSARGLGGVWRWASLAAALVLVLALVPVARQRARQAHAQIDQARGSARQVQRLLAAVAADGGAAQINSCGQPVTILTFQSTLAWAVRLNVGEVGYKPARSIKAGHPIVLFMPSDQGWKVRPIHTPAADAARCAALQIDYDIG